MLFQQYAKYLLGMSVAAVLTSCGGGQQDQNKTMMGMGAGGPVSVTDTVIAPVKVSYSDAYPAATVAFNQVNIVPQVTGYVKGIYFKDGQTVSKGQLLYRIDAQVYDANMANARATVAVQEANLVKARKDYDRYHQLLAQDAVARQLVDNADAAYDAAKKQLEAARASARSIESNVSFTELRAPFSGTIGISQVRTGAAVFQGNTILNTVSTNDPMGVDINIDQSQLVRYESLFKSNANLFTLSLGGTNEYEEKGKIATIDRAVDQQSGTIKVRLSFPNSKGILKPGMTNMVNVPNDANSGGDILIPQTALVEQLGEFYVYVIGDSSKVHQQHVTTGRQLGKNIVIKDGLSAGQHIVTTGVSALIDGAKVTTAPPAAMQRPASK